MKTLIQSTLIVGLIVASCGTTLAQEKTTNNGSGGGAIVVLDVAKVFKENANFTQQIQRIQSEAEKLKADVESRQQQLRAEAQNITENFKANSPERKSAEAKLEQDMTALRTYARQGETDLMSQEAKIYYETYLQMQTIVAEFAQNNGIALVLRFDSSDPDPANRNSIIGIVNRAVVYQKERDLTPHVIKEMNIRFAGAGATLQK